MNERTIVLREDVWGKIVKLAECEFRTPELQANYLLMKSFECDLFSKTYEPFKESEFTIGENIVSKKDEHKENIVNPEDIPHLSRQDFEKLQAKKLRAKRKSTVA